MDVVVILLASWLPLAIVVGVVIGRFLAHRDTTTTAPPVPVPDAAPPLPPRRTHSHTAYKCTCCDTHIVECVTDAARALQLASNFTCPPCTNTLAALEQDVTA